MLCLFLYSVRESHLLLKTKLTVDWLAFFCSVDDGFPVVRLHFSNALPMSVYPHDYLFEVRVSILY